MVGNLDLRRLRSSDNKHFGVFYCSEICEDSHISHKNLLTAGKIIYGEVTDRLGGYITTLTFFTAICIVIAYRK